MFWLINYSLRISGLGVVPANAGTHNHRRLWLEKMSNTLRRRIRRGVWVPAFAGTTTNSN